MRFCTNLLLRKMEVFVCHTGMLVMMMCSQRMLIFDVDDCKSMRKFSTRSAARRVELLQIFSRAKAEPILQSLSGCATI